MSMMRQALSRVRRDVEGKEKEFIRKKDRKAVRGCDAVIHHILMAQELIKHYGLE